MESAALADAYARALQAERARNGRQIAFFRFAGVGALFAVNLAFALFRAQYIGAAVLPLGAYWAAAGAVLWVRRRSQATDRWGGLAIPLLDMPVVFLLLRDLVGRLHAAGFDSDAVGVATQAPLFYLLLILAGSLSLESRFTWFAAAVAIALQAVLFRGEHRDFSFILIVSLATVFGTTLGLYARRRSITLVRHAALEQMRREHLGRYFSPQVAAALGDAQGELGRGRSCEVTVLFADLRDFTELAGRLTGEEVVALLNDFHSRMVERVFAYGGTLDKYLGDGLMAYFGAPVPQADHADRAVRCALDMQDALAAMNRGRAGGQLPNLRMGIGVHTGTVVLGDIGAERRREFTAIGDTVNVAARIEQLTKAEGIPVLVSEATRVRVAEAIGFSPMAPMAVKGKAAPLQLYRAERAARLRSTHTDHPE
jgi:adenylate cyclase